MFPYLKTYFLWQYTPFHIYQVIYVLYIMNYTYLFAKGITGSIKVVLLDVMMLGCTGLEKFIEEVKSMFYLFGNRSYKSKFAEN